MFSPFDQRLCVCNDKWVFYWLPQTGSFIHSFQVELGGGGGGVGVGGGRVSVFVGGEKPEYPEKNPGSRDENQQQTQPTYGVNIKTKFTIHSSKC